MLEQKFTSAQLIGQLYCDHNSIVATLRQYYPQKFDNKRE